MDVPELLKQRARDSEQTLSEFRKRVAREASAVIPDNLAIFCAGSYARLEASDQSDIDLFFVYGPDALSISNRTREIQTFSRVIDIASAMDFPPFSNDGEHLRTMSCADVMEHLGSPADDAKNLFTLRMLLLLESKCLFNDSDFAAVQSTIIDSYYRDYPDHQSSFEPWFLLNDIGRFWKTLLLNYENKRNQRQDAALELLSAEELEFRKNKQKVRNFKLKYSRMTTCFATIGALASLGKPVQQQDVFDLIQLTPQERLQFAAENVPSVSALILDVLQSYSWFLTQTAKTTEDLHADFADKSLRQERFRHANDYGDLMFKVLRGIAQAKDPEDERLLRFLVL